MVGDEEKWVSDVKGSVNKCWMEERMTRKQWKHYIPFVICMFALYNIANVMYNSLIFSSDVELGKYISMNFWNVLKTEDLIHMLLFETLHYAAESSWAVV